MKKKSLLSVLIILLMMISLIAPVMANESQVTDLSETEVEKKAEIEVVVAGIQKTSAYISVFLKNSDFSGERPEGARIYISTTPISENNPGECIENLSKTVSNLEPGTIYYVVGEAEINGVICRSEEVTFTTLAENTELKVTIYPERVTENSIGIGMNVNLLGDSTYNKVFFSEAPITEANIGEEARDIRGDLDYIGEYTGFNAANLNLGTTYYFVGQTERDGVIYRSEQISVTTLGEGENPVVVENIENRTVLDSERLNYLAQKNSDIILQGKNYQFKFEKGTLKEIEPDAEYDFGVVIGDSSYIPEADSLIKDNEKIASTIHFNHHGKLPAMAEITLNIGRAYAGKVVDYYRYNPETKEMELVAEKLVVDELGNVIVKQDSCSDYIFTVENESKPDEEGGNTNIDGKDEEANPPSSTDNQTSDTEKNSSKSTENKNFNPNTGIEFVDNYFNELIVAGVLIILFGTGILLKRKQH
ncbi:hypothetical protein [Eubacterium limosum]|uniref:hypothetical protein n=1 Tax=Eubacterium limosum TaxID=1736 RepID=UPI0010630C76|nr:hypothetical protein [Eubacterium limosum]